MPKKNEPPFTVRDAVALGVFVGAVALGLYAAAVLLGALSVLFDP